MIDFHLKTKVIANQKIILFCDIYKKMNQNKKVLQFVLLATVSLLALSLFIHYNNIANTQLQNISILSDVFKQDTIEKKIAKQSLAKDSVVFVALDTTKKNDNNNKQLHHFNTPNRITNFSVDTNTVVLDNFIKKLIELKKTKKGKIRIAYLGDSMIEGDLVSQTLRRLLQKYFGGSGVGFVPITSAVAGFRTSIKHTFSGKWHESNFKNRISTSPLFLSGKTFFANGYNWMDAEDKTYTYKSTPLKKYLLCGYKPGSGQIAINSIFNSIKPSQIFNNILVDSSFKANIKLEVSDALLPLYGVSFESQEGIIVDNFSFRGLGGFEFINMDADFLKQVASIQPYDLIIMQYGVNVLNKPNNNSFDWYYKSMLAAVNKLKKCFDNTDFLLVSAADKSFKYSNGTHTAIGMDSLIATQERIAFDAKIAFFNTYYSMGGYNSMVNWATGNPQLAAKDFTHLNAKGAEVLGEDIYKSIMFEIEKSEKH